MARARSQRSIDIWPGFVDALGTLLLVIMFLLVVFVLAQFFLSQALSGRDAALVKLNQQVSELAELLGLERQANADLRLNVAQLSASLQESTARRDELVLKLDTMTQRAEQAEQTLDEARQTVNADKETIKARLTEIESLKRDIVALRDVRRKMESEVSAMASALELAKEDQTALAESLARSEERVKSVTGDLESSKAELARLLKRLEERQKLVEASKEEKAKLTTELGAERDRSKELTARLASERERTLLAQKEIEKREIRLSELQSLYLESEDKLVSEKKISASARQQVALLNQQIKALREQLSRIETALDIAETKDRENKVVIADLGKRLNSALASKVAELSRYRSEFFGRLRDILGQRRDINIVGDRFVFQSEVLFASGSAVLGEEGQDQLSKLAEALKQLAREIPKDIDWILRIDGHTDVLPIHTAQFPSNWELSAARAISVAKFLIVKGVPANRLAAAGFAQYQPLDDRQDEISYRRNRRIELKLTQR